jgi:phage antirepressor YoqD-like protein
VAEVKRKLSDDVIVRRRAQGQLVKDIARCAGVTPQALGKFLRRKEIALRVEGVMEELKQSADADRVAVKLREQAREEVP